MFSPLVSLVIPIYNPGNRLKICLQSLINQTFKNIEIICVLDCPTDDSIQIVKSFAKMDSRIHFIENISNLHIGFSRNKGLKYARGKFVMFIDDDDYCEPNMIELLYNEIIRTGKPVCGSNRNYVTEEGVLLVDYDEAHVPNHNTCSYLLEAIIKRNGHCNANGIWTKLFNRSFLGKHQILFEDTRIISAEDSLFNFQVFLALKEDQTDIAFVNETLYHHVDNPHNTAKTVNYELGLMNYREKLMQIATKHELHTFDFEFYIGNIAQLYTMYKKLVINKSITQDEFFNKLCSCPHIVNSVLHHHKLYTKLLSFPKNLFAHFLYLKLNSIGCPAIYNSDNY